MAETPTTRREAREAQPAGAPQSRERAGRRGHRALRRYLPKNFGVDLEPPARGRRCLAADRREAQGVCARAPFDPARPLGRAHPHHRAWHVRRLCRHRRQAGRARRLARSAADAQGGGRPGGLRRAARSARPQRRDPRDRRQDDVGLRRAAPHHRQGRGGRADHRRAAGRRRQGTARAARLEEGLRLGQAPDHAEGAGGNLPSRPAGRRLPAGEQARLSQRADRRACDRLRRQGQHRHRRHGEISRRAEPDRSACRRLRRRSRQPEAGPAVARPQGDARAARRTRRPAWSASTPRRRPG